MMHGLIFGSPLLLCGERNAISANRSPEILHTATLNGGNTGNINFPNEVNRILDTDQ